MIKAELVKELRERTGSGIMDCKKALQETEGNIEKAVVYLRERGLAAAAKKAGRATKEGIIEAYIHAGGKLGVLIEVNCETDFVAKTEDYQTLCRELAMQVAATNPTYAGLLWYLLKNRDYLYLLQKSPLVPFLDGELPYA